MIRSQIQLKRFEKMIEYMTELELDLLNQDLPCKSDTRLMSAELDAIKTVNYLLDECITNLREAIKQEEE